jgi:hypothetical protein
MTPEHTTSSSSAAAKIGSSPRAARKAGITIHPRATGHRPPLSGRRRHGAASI